MTEAEQQERENRHMMHKHTQNKSKVQKSTIQNRDRYPDTEDRESRVYNRQRQRQEYTKPESRFQTRESVWGSGREVRWGRQAGRISNQGVHQKAGKQAVRSSTEIRADNLPETQGCLGSIYGPYDSREQ